MMVENTPLGTKPQDQLSLTKTAEAGVKSRAGNRFQAKNKFNYRY